MAPQPLCSRTGLRSSAAAADPPHAPRLLMEAKYETLNALRTPAFALPFIVIPVVIYLLFGVLIAGDAGDKASSAQVSRTISSRDSP